MQHIDLIAGTEKVISIFGYWPSFHDAEVISFSVSRAFPGMASVNSAALTVHVRDYKQVGAGTSSYELVCCKSILIELVFHDVHNLSLSEFNHQNVIDSISLNYLDGVLIDVEVESVWGFGGVIQCKRVEVGRVTRLAIDIDK